MVGGKRQGGERSCGAVGELEGRVDGGPDIGEAVCWRRRKLLQKLPVVYTQLSKLQHGQCRPSDNSQVVIAVRYMLARSAVSEQNSAGFEAQLWMRRQ